MQTVMDYAVATELTELKAGLEAAFTAVAHQRDLGSCVRVSGAHLEILAAEISRYMPELAHMLVVAGRHSLEATSRPVQNERPLGAQAMIGFALQDNRASRSTADWMKELREGDTD
jgi:hypothetical protein